MNIIIRIPIAGTTKVIIAPLEEDHFNHRECLLMIDDKNYGLISERTEKHPRFNNRSADSLEAINHALPDIDDRVGVDALRDPVCGVYIL
jgi:hypothetical protein